MSVKKIKISLKDGKLNIFEKRIFYKEKVYLLLNDCADVLETDIKTLENVCDEIVEIDGIGKCITEDEFNYVFREYFEDSPAVEQFTTFNTLDVKAAEILRFYPMRRIFADSLYRSNASRYGLSIDEYIEKIEFPNEVNAEKAKLDKRYDIKKKIEEYKAELAKGIESVHNIPFNKYGIELRHLSVLEKGHISIFSYYVGEGIFWHIMPEMMCDDFWEESSIDEKGSIVVPSADYQSGFMILSKDIKRDFRKYSVMENILYCLDTIAAKDEWHDYVELRQGGVNISVSKAFLMKLINEKNCIDMYYIDGIPEIE